MSLSTIFQQQSPVFLRARAEDASVRLLSVLSQDEHVQLLALLSDEVLQQQMVRALIGSEYVLDSCCRQPKLLLEWLLSDVHVPLSAERITEMTQQACSGCETTEAIDRALRQLRRQLMVGIIWRDVNRLSDFSEVCLSMTTMAEVMIQHAVDFHYRELTRKHGTPIGVVSGMPQPLLVLGMGKLGGAELNLSSDIDLIFAFPEMGETNHARRPLDNPSFFIRLGQRVIKTLNDVTVDGFVFRVDMRLRPYGQSGALVSSFASLENYYQTQGRDWERFAAIKARVVACSSLSAVHDATASDSSASHSLTLQQAAVDDLYAILQPFTYRKYTDFSVIESLRKLKALIVQEVRRKGMETNVKLGAGGIRELEFITQAFQLVSGGREPELQERHWLTVLGQLQQQGVFDAPLITALREAYIFLRQTEHVIQAYRDEQTQQLPEDSTEKAIVAWLMLGTRGDGSVTEGDAKQKNWSRFMHQLQQHRRCVSEQFQLVIADPDDVTDQVVNDDAAMWLSLWLECHTDSLSSPSASVEENNAEPQKSPPDEFVFFLQQQGYQTPEKIIYHTVQLRECWAVKQLSSQRREALDGLMPQVFVITSQLEQPDIAAQRLLVWLSKVVGRSSYITLLLENPQALTHLATLFQGSVWIAELMAKMPALLDEMLDMVNLYTLPSKAELQDELRIRLLRVDQDDVEHVMEVLRYFKLSHGLRVAASELSGRLPLMKVSDYLTWIAEVVLESVLALAWYQLANKHGVPRSLNDANRGFQCATQDGTQNEMRSDSQSVPNALSLQQCGFIIVAYGKMGGIELSYGSDLDLVFIYKAEAQSLTDGAKPIDAQTFYTRLGQKIIHILNTRTLSGPLYEVDMRLRPSGNSGLLATSLSAFLKYQQQDAWTWEHQALVRARPVAGDIELIDEFNVLRQGILQRQRDYSTVGIEVVGMREKMRTHLSTEASAEKRSYQLASAADGEWIKEGDAEDDHYAENNRLFHLKQDAGGIVDIEFMVQYVVLAWAQQYPALAEYTDNIRILECLETATQDNMLAVSGLDSRSARRLIEIYQSYRAVVHRLSLQEQSPVIRHAQMQHEFTAYQLEECRRDVETIWHQWMPSLASAESHVASLQEDK
ncbi:bifunctional [glutamate--ammonia ligase]-adenylyl-L-tyrosine phosphorylase/[glutamate--ammonia-ligase] adenylyltransferase [Eionea flava]